MTSSSPEPDPKAKLIQVVVENYIDRTEKELERERRKNARVKKMAEELARQTLKISPQHKLAEDMLALLLEVEMKRSE